VITAGYDKELPKRLLAELGFVDFDLKRDSEGAPIWPKGVSGSISNIKKKTEFTAVSVSKSLRSIGIDIELLSRAETAFRCRSMFLKEEISVSPVESLLCFSAKEAIYKALHPLIKKRFWFSAVSVTEINEREIILKPEDFLVGYGFIESFKVEYKIFDQICFTMLKIC